MDVQLIEVSGSDADIDALVEGLQAAFTAYQERVEREGKLLFANIAKSLPDGVGIRWQQYTPGFNDGEPCTFSVDEAEVIGVEFNEDGVPEDQGDAEFENGEVEKRCEALATAITGLEEGLFLTLFDDGWQIILTNKGIHTEEYDCGY